MHDDPDLADDEIVLWQGAPDPRAHFSRWDAILVPATVVWSGVTVFLVVRGFATDPPVPVSIAMVVLLGLAAYLLLGRFFVKARAKRRTRYVLTTHRAIISGVRGTDSIELHPEVIRVSRTPWSEHVTVVFGMQHGPFAQRGFGSSGSMLANSGADALLHIGRGAPFAFHDVADRDALFTALDDAGIPLRDRSTIPPIDDAIESVDD